MKRLVLMLILVMTAGVMAVSCGTDEKLETLNQKLDELNQQMDQMQQDLDKFNDDLGLVGEVYVKVDEPAAFYGGEARFNKYIQQNLEIPEDAVDGRVLVELIINKTGKVINVKIQKTLSYSCDAAALKVCHMLPDFIPARLDGKPVSYRMSVPITFHIKNS